MEYIGLTQEEAEDVKHYGVKGMKWRKHKAAQRIPNPNTNTQNELNQLNSAKDRGRTEKRKTRNRKLNRIDGVTAKQGKAARRQLAMWYNRRNRKNLKNA